MNFLKDILSPIADFFGIIGFLLTVPTYINTKKIKFSDDRVSFNKEKDAILLELREKQDIITKYINSEMELEPCLQAMRDVLALVNHLKQYCIWNEKGKKAFSAFSRHEPQVKQISALDKQDRGHDLEDIPEVIKQFISHLEITIAIIEKQE